MKKIWFPLSGAVFLVAIAGAVVLWFRHHPDVSRKKSLVDGKTVSRLVESVTHRANIVREIFPGPSGLTGVVLQSGAAAPAVVWVTPDGKTLFAGNLYGSAGKNFTDLAFKRVASRFVPSVGAGQKISLPVSGGQDSLPGVPVNVSDSSLSTLSMVPEGSGAKSIRVFIDPNCSWCHKFWVMLHPGGALVPDLEIDWVPIGFLSPSSKGMAEKILRDKVDALKTDETGFDEKDEKGGIDPIDDPSLRKSVDANLVFLSSLTSVSTPSILFETKSGMRLYSGFPSDDVWKAILASIVEKKASPSEAGGH